MATTKSVELKKPEFETILNSVATALAAKIGGSWQTEFKEDYHYPCCHLVQDGKTRFWVQNSWPYGKLQFSISLDKTEQPTSGRSYAFDQLWKQSTTEINCSYSKTAGAIAADIKRRLWPSVGELVAKAIEDGDNEKKRQAYEKQGIAKLVEAIGNAGEYRDGNNSGHSPYINLKLGEGYGDIKAAFYSAGNASVSIELKSLPLEAAIEVCKALQAIKHS
jgi:hypothetical protein